MIGNEEYQYSNNYLRWRTKLKKKKEFVFNMSIVIYLSNHDNF